MCSHFSSGTFSVSENVDSVPHINGGFLCWQPQTRLVLSSVSAIVDADVKFKCRPGRSLNTVPMAAGPDPRASICACLWQVWEQGHGLPWLRTGLRLGAASCMSVGCCVLGGAVGPLQKAAEGSGK